MGLNYQPTEKITLFVQGGAEFRQYESAVENGQNQPSGSVTNPIFSTGATYAPFDSTALSLNAFQNLHSSSANSGQTDVSTGVGIAATQRFFQRFFLGFSFNYSHEEAQSSSGNSVSGTVQAGPEGTVTTGGSEDVLVYRPSLSFAPNAWTSVALYYQYLDNESNTAGASYHDNQMGISVSAQF
jgi:hypothetical protein